MRERTPAGREYATLAAGAGGSLPGGISMAVETIWKRSGLAFQILLNTFPEADSHGAGGGVESRNPAASAPVVKLMTGRRIHE